MLSECLTGRLSLLFADVNSNPEIQIRPDLEQWSSVIYLLAAVLFILGLKGLTHPRRAVRGNLLGALGMAVAAAITVVVLWNQTDLVKQPILPWLIVGGAVVGALLGGVLALFIKMTAMPQLVALFNGLGGIASVLVAGAAVVDQVAVFEEHTQLKAHAPSYQFMVAAIASGIIGAVTFTGSLVAFGKLQELKIFKKPFTFPGQKVINAALVIGSIGLGVMLYQATQSSLMVDRDQIVLLYVGMCVAALVLGVLLVSPIGGADMPVVIALLNSYSGLAASAAGFVIENTVLIVAGALVGASGLVLTKIMCKAMNRSLFNVLFGVMEGGTSVADQDEVYAGKIKSTSAEEVAMLFDGVRRVIIVPGYGLAVAQAQHAVRDLADLLEARDVEVEFAIHPVAGRMPGHMNVLLAEAEVSYDKLKEMDAINPTFAQCDIALVIGANDVVNPVARTDPHSPIAGMPILDVDKARTVVVVKRSLSPGFAGIPNPLFAADNCLMYFGDGKKAIVDLVAALNEE